MKNVNIKRIKIIRKSFLINEHIICGNFMNKDEF